MLVLRYEKLLAEKLKSQIFISHVTLVYVFLNRYLSLKLDIHVYLHGLKLIIIMGASALFTLIPYTMSRQSQATTSSPLS